MSTRSRLLVLGVALAAACAPAGASAAARCGADGYAYAGLVAAKRAQGVRATVETRMLPQIADGHTAAWVGVGGYGAGPRHQDEWLQVGLAAFPEGGTRLYYEVTTPTAGRRYVELDPAVDPNERHRVAVSQMTHRPAWWRVWLDGRPASDPIFLPASRRGWEPVATAETWDGGTGVCNSFDYGFTRLAVKLHAGGRWRQFGRGSVLKSPGYRLIGRSATAFIAARAE